MPVNAASSADDRYPAGTGFDSAHKRQTQPALRNSRDASTHDAVAFLGLRAGAGHSTRMGIDASVARDWPVT